MIIAKYILKKFLISNLIILSSFMSLFFIISLVDNLNLKTNFFIIVLISLLDSFSLILLIPEVVFLFCSVCFCIILKFSNELLILRHYLNKKKILLLFVVFILFYLLINISKNNIDESISLAKYNLINENLDNFIKNKLVVLNKFDQKVIYELNNINIEQKDIGSIKIHKFNDDKFESSLNSESVEYDSEKITLYNPTLITSKNITKINGKYTYELKLFEKIFYSGEEILYLDNFNYDNYSYNNIVKLLNFVILLILLSMAFISKKILKSNLITFVYTAICFVLVIYNFMINFINVQFFTYVFITLSVLINFLLFIYFYFND